MEEVVVNELQHNGIRRVKVIGDAEIHMAQYQAWVPCDACARVEILPGHDNLLDLFSLELRWPVFEPWEVANYGPKKFRRLMMVHFAYAERVSAVIELGRLEFFARTHFAPGYAFMRELPQAVEDGMDYHGLVLLRAEWMPAQCVAVGGRDG
jgi:hypothetical protein